MSLSIKNTTRSALGRSRRVYADVARDVLPDWELSLVFVGPQRARNLNTSLRGKTYTPNVLSYVAGEKSAEIIICPSVAKMEAPARGLDDRDYILYLFIHGALHIKGWAHSARMDACEEKLMAKFATSRTRTPLHATTHRNGNRHRHLPSKDGSSRRALR